MSKASASPIGNRHNVKIFVLYLMKNVGYPMDFVTVNEIIMQTDYVAYLDFAEAFREMEDDSLIAAVPGEKEGETLYQVTSRGALVADSLKGELLPSVLDESLACALRYLDFTRRGVKATCRVEPTEDGAFLVVCGLTEKGNTLMSVSLRVTDRVRADKMEAQFRSRPETIFRGVTALLSGNVNYLLDP